MAEGPAGGGSDPRCTGEALSPAGRSPRRGSACPTSECQPRRLGPPWPWSSPRWARMNVSTSRLSTHRCPKRQRSQGLVLCARGHILVRGKVGQERRCLTSAHFAGMALVVEEDVALDPVDAGLVGAVGVVFQADGVARLTQGSLWFLRRELGGGKPLLPQGSMIQCEQGRPVLVRCGISPQSYAEILPQSTPTGPYHTETLPCSRLQHNTQQVAECRVKP